jgi:hypothetical protein
MSICCLLTFIVYRPPKFSISVPGLLKNYNTIEDFKNADKTALFNTEADAVRDCSFEIISSFTRRVASKL